jgi:SAM-dependent methyltransferase
MPSGSKPGSENDLTDNVDRSGAGARATWAAGDWDTFARLLAPVGELVLERSGLRPGMTLADVGTGSGGTIAIPAAQRGAKVVGVDVTPELLVQARARSARAGVEVEWVEADAQDLPFADGTFDRVISTFGAMFATDHVRAAAELVRVCAPQGRIVMTTWVNEGFAGGQFKLTGSFMPPPAPGIEAPPLWGVEEHIDEVFAAAGARAVVVRESVDFEFSSVDEAVRHYTQQFGPFVMARAVLKPQGRWEEFVGAFAELVARFNRASDGSAKIESSYFLITVDR